MRLCASALSNNNMKFKILVPALLFLQLACVKDKPVQQPASPVQLSAGKKVYAINEGNFGNGNASVSVYDAQTAQVVENIYASVNNGALGDVAQSLNYFNGRFYLVVNNSAKITVCDQTFKRLGDIRNLDSPRHILPVSNQKAYVSDLYANAIHIVDLNTNTKVGAIRCPGWTEQMQAVYARVFVCNLRSDYVYVINSLTDQKTDSVFVGVNAGSMVVDKNDKVWVLSSGNKSKQVAGRLTRIHPLSLAVEASFVFDGATAPSNLCMNKTKDTLYYLAGGVYRMPVGNAMLPATTFVTGTGANFYGLGVDPNTHAVFVADALDYIQRSNAYVYSASGKLTTSFKAGINCNGFYFE